MRLQQIMRPKLILAAAGLSLIIACPVSSAIQSRDKVIKSQQGENHSLQLKIDQMKKDQSKPVSSANTSKQAAKSPVSVSQPSAQPISPSPSLATTQQPAPQPQPASTPAPAPRSSGGCSQYASIFNQYNWNPSIAMAICQAESGGNPNSISPAGLNFDGVSDFGLMQLHGIPILDPAANVAYAYTHKYLTQGWGAWSTYTSGIYTKYL